MDNHLGQKCQGLQKKCLKPCNLQGFKTQRASAERIFKTAKHVIYLNIYMLHVKCHLNYIQTLRLQCFRTPKLFKLDDSEITVHGIVTKFHQPTLDQSTDL